MSKISEQDHISSFFTFMAQKIEIMSQQREKIIQMKKYFLNKMFVNN